MKTHVVEEGIPLLLSRKSMKEREMVIDTGRDEVKCFGGTAKMNVTSSGHVTIPIKNTSKILLVQSSQPEDPVTVDKV